MAHSAIAVLTFKSRERILSDGGTESWKLKKSTAEQFDYVVCTRNVTNPNSEGPEAHRSAFLIGKISKVVASTETADRFKICFSQYATVNLPDIWKAGWRNPVRYTTLEELGIDLERLDFKEMSWADVVALAHVKHEEDMNDMDFQDYHEHSEDAVRPLTIRQAKEGLSAAFDVPVEAIEIIIRA
ncbi:hypothetical protein [Rhizobium sp.]|uniref:hypothetical protein n=1 Tax=Rhizobium sp. TaxID=391 RepID=UPI0034C61863